MKHALQSLKHGTVLALLILASCGKDKPTSQSAKPITKQDLLGIYVVVEYGYANTARYGTESYLQLISFTDNNGELRSNSFQNDASYRGLINEPVYAPETGITTINVHNSIFLPLTRNDAGEIVLAATPSYRASDYQVRHAERYRVTDATPVSGSRAQAVEGGNGFYAFSNGKWQFAQTNTFPALSWDYETLFPFAWRGFDRGAAGYGNFGVTIPLGEGWKGQHKNDRLMLLCITDDNVSLSGVVICKLL